MAKQKRDIIKQAIDRLPDGTVKQKNMLTGTEVWTVPGRGHRPVTAPPSDTRPIEENDRGSFCAFCEDRYLETPPEKARIIRIPEPNTPNPNTPDPTTTEPPTTRWIEKRGLSATEITEEKAEFRRIPNLFEIVSYNYWHLNHDYQPSEQKNRQMAQYLSQPAGYDHVMRVVRAKLLASGHSEDEIAALPESELLGQAKGFFAGGHDLIVPRRHYTPTGTLRSHLASSGTLTPDEHAQYIAFTTRSMADLYQLNKDVAYVVTFQNWLKPAGASFEHLHKQLVAIDSLAVQTQAEIERLREHPDIYDDLLQIGVTRKLLVAQNKYAVAMAGFGHRYPSVEIWPLGAPRQPWEYSPEQLRGISDVLHAAHAATGVHVPCNEEWQHRPPSCDIPVRTRILLKWRISTMAGFEGGTRIYLNTISPWDVHRRLVAELTTLRAAGTIATDLKIGDECKLTPAALK